VIVEKLEDSKYLDNVLDVAKKIIEFTIQINKKSNIRIRKLERKQLNA